MDDKIPEIQSSDPHLGARFTSQTHHDTYSAIDPTSVDLLGQAVFITGASRGIGSAIAVAFAKAGASFIGLGARGSLSNTEEAVLAAAKQIGKPQPIIVAVNLDVTDTESMIQAAAKIDAHFRKLDILVNNAGWLETGAPIHESDPMSWWQSFEVNVKGVYLSTRAFMPLLLKTPPSSSSRQIINLTSIGALMVIPGMSAYNTAKLAICRFTEYTAVEYAHQGVIAISLHPGGVATDMGLSLPGAMHTSLTDTPELAADTVVWLMKERREWLNGRYVSCQWDLPELEAKKKEIEERNLLKNKMLV
ncbi:short chain dehydrogenase reductase [Lophium mytilinum]|uniref:Short chain dehydrogenase reductase n=1 Tax=Lophium mytilinum TaxID=390894 RepID=A0A6A6QSG4_9PEZI|nr:short chain dehydrogenase reductase [Lophium mytilinum]